MNANHARPMLAFWLLALVAVVISSGALRNGGPDVRVRGGSPSPVTRSTAPEPVRASSLGPVPSGPATAGATGLVISAGALEYATRLATLSPQVTVQPPRLSPSARTSTPQGARAVTTPTATATATPTAGPARDQAGSQGSGPTSTATPTTSAPDAGHPGTGSEHAPAAPGKSASH